MSVLSVSVHAGGQVRIPAANEYVPDFKPDALILRSERSLVRSGSELKLTVNLNTGYILEQLNYLLKNEYFLRDLDQVAVDTMQECASHGLVQGSPYPQCSINPAHLGTDRHNGMIVVKYAFDLYTATVNSASWGYLQQIGQQRMHKNHVSLKTLIPHFLLDYRDLCAHEGPVLVKLLAEVNNAETHRWAVLFSSVDGDQFVAIEVPSGQVVVYCNNNMDPLLLTTDGIKDVFENGVLSVPGHVFRINNRQVSTGQIEDVISRLPSIKYRSESAGAHDQELAPGAWALGHYELGYRYECRRAYGLDTFDDVAIAFAELLIINKVAVPVSRTPAQSRYVDMCKHKAAQFPNNAESIYSSALNLLYCWMKYYPNHKRVDARRADNINREIWLELFLQSTTSKGSVQIMRRLYLDTEMTAGKLRETQEILSSMMNELERTGMNKMLPAAAYIHSSVVSPAYRRLLAVYHLQLQRLSFGEVAFDVKDFNRRWHAVMELFSSALGQVDADTIDYEYADPYEYIPLGHILGKPLDAITLEDHQQIKAMYDPGWRPEEPDHKSFVFDWTDHRGSLEAYHGPYYMVYNAIEWEHAGVDQFRLLLNDTMTYIGEPQSTARARACLKAFASSVVYLSENYQASPPQFVPYAMRMLFDKLVACHREFESIQELLVIKGHRQTHEKLEKSTNALRKIRQSSGAALAIEFLSTKPKLIPSYEQSVPRAARAQGAEYKTEETKQTAGVPTLHKYLPRLRELEDGSLSADQKLSIFRSDYFIGFSKSSSAKIYRELSRTFHPDKCHNELLAAVKAAKTDNQESLSNFIAKAIALCSDSGYQYTLVMLVDALARWLSDLEAWPDESPDVCAELFKVVGLFYSVSVNATRYESSPPSTVPVFKPKMWNNGTESDDKQSDIIAPQDPPSPPDAHRTRFPREGTRKKRNSKMPRPGDYFPEYSTLCYTNVECRKTSLKDRRCESTMTDQERLDMFLQHYKLGLSYHDLGLVMALNAMFSPGYTPNPSTLPTPSPTWHPRLQFAADVLYKGFVNFYFDYLGHIQHQTAAEERATTAANRHVSNLLAHLQSVLWRFLPRPSLKSTQSKPKQQSRAHPANPAEPIGGVPPPTPDMYFTGYTQLTDEGTLVEDKLRIFITEYFLGTDERYLRSDFEILRMNVFKLNVYGKPYYQVSEFRSFDTRFTQAVNKIVSMYNNYARHLRDYYTASGYISTLAEEAAANSAFGAVTAVLNAYSKTMSTLYPEHYSKPAAQKPREQSESKAAPPAPPPPPPSQPPRPQATPSVMPNVNNYYPGMQRLVTLDNQNKRDVIEVAAIITTTYRFPLHHRKAKYFFSVTLLLFHPDKLTSIDAVENLQAAVNVASQKNPDMSGFLELCTQFTSNYLRDYKTYKSNASEIDPNADKTFVRNLTQCMILLCTWIRFAINEVQNKNQ